MPSSATTRLCEWVTTTQYKDIPREIRDETVTILYDQVGGMIASSTLLSCRPVIEFIQTVGDNGACTIVGHPFKTSVINAALANGTIAHGDEVDAMGSGGSGHFPATTVPAALVVGEYARVPGRDFIRSLALGSEISARFHRTLNHYQTRTQFYSGVGGTMGAAVTAGLLLGLNSEEMESALGLAAAGACGLTSFHLEELHQAKSLTLGRIVAAGVLAAFLAKHGLHGPRDILSVENGFFDAFLGIPSAGNDAIDGLGDDYAILPVGYKRYPVGGVDQTALHAFLHLQRTHNLNSEDIDQIEVLTTRNAFHTTATNRHPSIHMETILSLAAVYEAITFDHIHDPSYREQQQYRDFCERARVIVVPRPGRATSEQRLGATVTVRTCGGETYSDQLHYPQMSSSEIHDKFRSLVGTRLDNDLVMDLEEDIKNVEAMDDMASLVESLGLAYRDQHEQTDVDESESV